MRFCLLASLKFNEPIGGFDEEIRNALEKASDLFSRGAPAGEGAKLEGVEVRGDELRLLITSGRYVRPHAALLRLKRFLASELGRKLKLGVRELRGLRYEIEFELSERPLERFKLPFVKEVEIREKRCRLLLEDVGEEFLAKGCVDRLLRLAEEKVERQHYKGKAEHHRVVWQSQPQDHRFESDPSRVMQELGWIQRFGRGQWILAPPAARLMRGVEELVLKHVARPLGFQEAVLPKVVNWDVWKRSGHARSIYGEIYYVCPPKDRDPRFWEEIADEFKVTLRVPVEKLKPKLRDPIGGITYAQCPPFWPLLQGKTLARNSLPIKVYDRSGPSLRYEAGGTRGLERVDEFHRVELIWVGEKEEVVRIKDQLLERFRHLLSDVLELEWRMAEVTPWFMAQEGFVGEAEGGAITIDLETYLPYRGPRECEWLEVANVSVNGPKYPRAFSVKAQGVEELWSGCSGVGLERWMVTILSQKGFDPKGWPEALRKVVGELPKAFEFR